MGWKITFPDGTAAAIDELPVETFQQIALDEGVDWWDLYNEYPARTMSRFTRFVEELAKVHSITVDVPKTVGDFLAATEGDDTWISSVPQTPVIEGFPQTPGEPENGSTSTSPGGTDGPPTSSNDSPSEG